MTTNQKLIKGNIILLRERVDGWAMDNTTPAVFPDFPSSTLGKDEYPRAMVDVIGMDDVEQSVELDMVNPEVLVEITVFGTTPYSVTDKIDDVFQAILDHKDSNRLDNGEPYYEGWYLKRTGGTMDMLEVQTDRGFQRYQRSQEFIFETFKTSNN